ncbi:glycosyl hydrolase family 45-domain-containing protein [Cladochytrium replicatum]|nr:glycosyl hydrolase family 45-domain-containing protein [Cladochytrium replicatum]
MLLKRGIIEVATAVFLLLQQAGMASGACQSAYGQCGGQGWTGLTCCDSGYVCSTQNQYYAQCTPAPAGASSARTSNVVVTTTTSRSTTTTTTTTATRAPSSSSATTSRTTTTTVRVSSATTTTTTVPRTTTTSALPTGKCEDGYAKCGGDNYTGPGCCVADFTCSAVNQYYSQCLPGPTGGAGGGGPSLSWSHPGLTITTSGKAITPSPACPTADYQKCDAGSCCGKRSSCSSVNPNYSQCAPTNLLGEGHTVPADVASKTTKVVIPATPAPLNAHPEIAEELVVISDGPSGKGKTTRYWDCCKPSCSWDENSGYYANKVNNSVLALSSVGTVINNDQVNLVKNGCESTGNYKFIDGDGAAYMNPLMQPVIVNDQLSYGFAAVGVTGGLTEPNTCCNCYLITFTNTAAKGKQMVVQHVNTGGDLSDNHFDLQMPGGGLGIFDGCSKQFGVDASTWGARYGGVSKVEECDKLPPVLQTGCRWRFEWFLNADNPTIEFVQVVCPKYLVAQSGCRRYFA